MRGVVSNASTLILLAKIELLRTACELIHFSIHSTVEKEATYREELFDAQLIKRLIAEKRINVVREEHFQEQKTLKKDFNLADGEASALVMAKLKSLPLATDDGQAIKACKVLNVEFLTAIHFLVLLRRQRRIEKQIAVAKLENLKRLGRYKTDIIKDALREIEGR